MGGIYKSSLRKHVGELRVSKPALIMPGPEDVLSAYHQNAAPPPAERHRQRHGSGSGSGIGIGIGIGIGHGHWHMASASGIGNLGFSV